MQEVETVTAREIAQALDISREAVSRRARKGKWPYRTGKYRTRLYPLAMLPEDVQKAVGPRAEGGVAAYPKYCKLCPLGRQIEALDVSILRPAIKAVEQYLQEEGLYLAPDKKADLIILLSEEIQEEAEVAILKEQVKFEVANNADKDNYCEGNSGRDRRSEVHCA